MKGKHIFLCVLSAALALCLTACGAEPAAVVPQDPAMPTTKAQILQFYTDALTGAVDRKLSFAKRYKSSSDKFNLSPALSPFKSRLREYTGVDQEIEDATVTSQTGLADTYARYLLRPSLTQSDVRYASCRCIRGGLYRIELRLRDGESRVAPGINEYASALDKCGVTAGKKTDTFFDHKSAQNVYEMVRGYAPDVRIREQHSNVLIVAVFRPDGTPVQLNVRFDTSYEIKGVLDVGCTAKGTTKIRFVQFGAESPVLPDEDE